MHPSALLGLLAFAAAASAIPVQKKTAGSTSSIQNLKDKIKNVVVIVMENRSLDNLLGGQTIKGLENPINNGPFCNPLNVTDRSKGQACSAPYDYNSVLNDPDHSVYGNNLEFYGTFTPNNTQIANGELTPTQNGFVHEQIRLYSSDANTTVLSTEVMHYYTEQQVPVLTALTQNYTVFNNWHSDVPGPTNPNRIALTSGTPYGHGTNDFITSTTDGAKDLSSIFQTLGENNYTWKNYLVDDSLPNALFYNYVSSSGSDSLVQSIDNFYSDAENGSLPQFSYLDPSCCSAGTNSMHPSGLISDGETILKKVYEALRASPQWEQSLLIITFDETGGFHDHVPPPLAVRPDNRTYTTTTPNGEKYTFDFNRLGGRVPTWLVSPWVAKGYVEKKGTNSDGSTVSYSATSILRTLGYLWDFDPYTPRVEKAASFDHLILSEIRDDTPQTLPAVYDW